MRAERTRQELTLAMLAERSGTSRSMLSAIERGDRSPTVLVLDQIAGALGISVSRLLSPTTVSRVSVLRRQEQKVVDDRTREDAAAGFHRRVTSPVIEGVEFEMGRIEINPFVDAGVYPPHLGGWAEYVAVEHGCLAINLDGEEHILDAGDAIYFAADCEHAYRNPGPQPCIAYIAMLDHAHHAS